MKQKEFLRYNLIRQSNSFMDLRIISASCGNAIPQLAEGIMADL